MNVIRRNEQPHDQERHQLTASDPGSFHETYFFYEKNTGVTHFHVEAAPDGLFPVEKAAGLLAMHCMVRGQSPRDYAVMVQATHEGLEDLTEKAEKAAASGAFGGQFGQLDSSGRGSARRRHAKFSEQ